MQSLTQQHFTQCWVTSSASTEVSDDSGTLGAVLFRQNGVQLLSAAALPCVPRFLGPLGLWPPFLPLGPWPLALAPLALGPFGLWAGPKAKVGRTAKSTGPESILFEVCPLQHSYYEGVTLLTRCRTLLANYYPLPH